jgi:hypothetical protein
MSGMGLPMPMSPPPVPELHRAVSMDCINEERLGKKREGGAGGPAIENLPRGALLPGNVELLSEGDSGIIVG